MKTRALGLMMMMMALFHYTFCQSCEFLIG